jgi:hypothetical protein
MEAKTDEKLYLDSSSPVELGINDLNFYWSIQVGSRAHFVQFDSYLSRDSPEGDLPPNFRKGEIEDDPASEKAFAWILSCFNYCTKNHHKCPSNHDVSLPIRILDLKPSQGQNEVCLAETQGVKGKFTALSHRWGKVRNQNPSM